MPAAVDQPADQSRTGSLAQLRRVVQCDQICRIQSKQMGNVAVSDLYFLVILCPLLNLPVFADFQRRQFLQQGFQFCGKLSVPSQQLAAFDDVPEQHRQNFRIHKRSAAQAALGTAFGFIGIFRRHRRAGHQFALVVFREIVHEEQGSLPHCLVVLVEEFQVLCELVVLEDMQAEPCRTHRPDRRRHPQILRSRITPDVCVVVADKAAAAVHCLCGFPSVCPHAFDQVEQRQMTFRQIADFRRPVVHLNIDVNGIAAAPRRPHVLIPDTLQVHRLCPRAAGGQHQIPPIVEVQHCQLAVVDL